MINDDKINAQEALYMFCGWLTTRSEATVMGAEHDAAPIAERVHQFVVANNLAEVRTDFARHGEFPVEFRCNTCGAGLRTETSPCTNMMCGVVQ